MDTFSGIGGLAAFSAFGFQVIYCYSGGGFGFMARMEWALLLWNMDESISVTQPADRTIRDISKRLKYAVFYIRSAGDRHR